MDPRKIEHIKRGARLGLLIALYLAIFFLAGAALPYACEVIYVPAARLERAEQDLRAKMLELGRDAAEIEAAVGELHQRYRAKEEDDVSTPKP
jgi:hypothetical protein